jgi:hypothetical protein
MENHTDFIEIKKIVQSEKVQTSGTYQSLTLTDSRVAYS